MKRPLSPPRQASDRHAGGRLLGRLRVSALAGRPSRGKILAGTGVIPCSLGRAGIGVDKREGDGKTPAGVYVIQQIRVRRDRLPRIVARADQRPIHPHDGWSDDPTSSLYNRAVRLPSPVRHEELWRHDHLYDVVAVIGYNTGPVLKQRGSAIFLHLETPGRTPTAGCVAVSLPAIRKLLSRIGPRTRVVIKS